MRQLVFIIPFLLAALALSPAAVSAATVNATSPTADSNPAPASSADDPILGLWYTEGRDGGVEFYSCDDKICGRFRWIKDASLDTNNPDPKKRDRPLCHMSFISDFKPDGHGRYTGGVIYSPRHGQNFNAEMKLVDHDTLSLHGYVVVPLFGESQTWKRALTMPSCAE